MVVKGASKPVLEWASHKTGIQFREPSYALGITDNEGRLIGAAIFNDYDAKNVELTCIAAKTGAFRKDVCKAVAAHAFNDLGCERISLTVRADNEYVLRVASKFGWRAEGRKRRYYGDCDAIILGMMRDECRFLKD